MKIKNETYKKSFHIYRYKKSKNYAPEIEKILDFCHKNRAAILVTLLKKNYSVFMYNVLICKSRL